MLLSKRLADVPVLLADGATGTNLFEMGLISGEAPEMWLDRHPDRITTLHQSFVDAGADIILTNSFGGTSRRLMLHNAEKRVHVLNVRAAELARNVADKANRPIIVAGSVGPTGDLFQPLGPMTEAEAVDIFAEQIAGLKAGGADVIWIETMSALEEMRAAATAAAMHNMPYTLTASFDTAGRTMMGLTTAAFVRFAENLPIPPLAIGSNCGVGASDLVLSILGMSEANAALPLIAKANAGIPVIKGEHLHYSGTPAMMADYVALAAGAGARIIGGCCGSSPAHVQAMRRAVDTLQSGTRPDLETIVARLGPLLAPAPKVQPTANTGSTAETATAATEPIVQRSAPTSRRRPRGTRNTGAINAALPRLSNPWAPVEVLSADQVERILTASFRVLQEAGLEIRSAAARAIYAANGALVDDATQMVRLDRSTVESFLAHAPAQFVLHARNPDRDLHVGGRVVNFGPVNGAPNIRDEERGRRYGDIAAFEDILKVTHTLGILHWQGGVVVEPVDLPVPVRHLDIYMAHITCSDLVWAARGVGGVQARDAIAMSALEHGVSVDALAQRPTLMTVTNVNSPRRVDEDILDNIMIMARHGQCVVITPFTLMGAMAPVTLAGALVQQTAEALGIIALCQMLRPGAPCVMGGFTSNVDMRTGAPAFGTPEYVKACLATAQLARRLKIPVRTSAVNASPCVDAQAAYETGFSLWAAIMSHSHLINHAAGWLEGGLSASMEKIIVDAEMLRGWAAILKPIDFTEDDIAVDAIKDVAPGGHFFGSPHTIARYENAFYRPLLSDWSNFENWTEAGSRSATTRATALWKKARDEFVQPSLDPERREALLAYVARRKREINAGT
jgi:trimethylamine---corrinoid protein Co-methyltransferase